MRHLDSVASDTFCWQVLVPLEQNSTYPSSFRGECGKHPASLNLQAPPPGCTSRRASGSVRPRPTASFPWQSLLCACEKDEDPGRPKGPERMPVRAHTREYTFPGQGWGELRRTDHILSREQGGVLLWSGLGLAAGWPGSSKPPQTEWALLKRGWGKGGPLAPPRTHIKG